MQLTYTYWPVKGGGFIGYWNDYPDHWTEGNSLPELERMLRSLRGDIDAMIAAGTWAEPPRSVGAMEYA